MELNSMADGRTTTWDQYKDSMCEIKFFVSYWMLKKFQSTRVKAKCNLFQAIKMLGKNVFFAFL